MFTLFLKTTVFCVLIWTFATPVSAQVDYCPSTTTDTDGDGWGWENNRSCVVLPFNAPVCHHVLSDTDNDGWGWEHGASCLVDSTVERFTTTNNSSPLVGYIDLSFAQNGSTEMAVASNGTIYAQRFTRNTTSASRIDGTLLWETFFPDVGIGDFLRLDQSEENLITANVDGSIISMSTRDGKINWQTENPSVLVLDIQPGAEAIIVTYSKSATSPESQKSVMSLSYDGQLRWRYEPNTEARVVRLGRDGLVYIAVVKGRNQRPYETLFALRQ